MIAYLSQAPIVARAEEPRLILELNGGAVFGDSQNWAFVVPPAPSNRTIRPDTIYGGTVGFILPSGNLSDTGLSGWDVGVFARFGISNEENRGGTLPFPFYYYNVMGGTVPSGYYTGFAKHQERHLMVDFDARRDVGLGTGANSQAIFSAGVRFAYFNAETETLFQCGCGPSLTETRQAEFIGVGPRMGIESNIPLSKNVAFSWSAGGSVLFGRRNTNYISVGPVGNSSARGEFDFVPTLDARAAFTFKRPGTPAIFSVGVEANAWFGVYDQLNPFNVPGIGQGEENANRFSVSPFISLAIPLGVTGGEQSGVSTSDYGLEDQSPAERMKPLIEAEVRGGYLWRGGNQLNSSGAPFEEAENFPIVGASVLAATPLSANWLAQFEVDGELTVDNDTSGGVPTDDTYDRGYTAGGHLAYIAGPLQFGVFGGIGQTDIFSSGTVNQDADHRFIGAEGRYLSQTGSLAVQVGGFDISSANNEVLDDALFGKVIGQLFFNDGNTMLQGDVAYVSGTQDSDDVPFVNPTELIAWGVELEHRLGMNVGDAATSVFVGYQGALVREESTSGRIDRVNDNSVHAGIRFRFGASSPFEREYNSAPDLPDIHRWLGAVPAVD